MKIKDIAKRLTGLNLPGGVGASWNPPKPESETAQRLITELEDRRVLYNPSCMEIPDHCVRSVLEIRRFLTNELHQVKPNSKLSDSMKAMRAACRKFLDTMDADNRIVRFGGMQGHYASWQFNGAIGELRGVFGIHLVLIAAQYKINIEEPLSTILPLEADEA